MLVPWRVLPTTVAASKRVRCYNLLIGSMELAYLHTFTINVCHSCIGKYTIVPWIRRGLGNLFCLGVMTSFQVIGCCPLVDEILVGQ